MPNAGNARILRLPESGRTATGSARLRPTEQQPLAMTSPDPNLRQVIVLVPYSLLCLPASITVAGYAALVKTRDISHFEGGAGYAWLWLTIVLTLVFYLLGIGFAVLLRKRPAILVAITVAFAALSVPTFKAACELLS
ncbi:hypothetical protein NTJ56_01170 [Burkholderia contaminans]|uniref:hypothetical protein n=2 Tax=Burkholderia contaminans TaxID=488447 RepID=UPI001CF29ADE|nr:hypothetical protein [Burkholderia contaminans]MCA7920457.1 hypothetical protein [Burkholderia contaminans]MCA8102587.1 hypothetical protein [Burkholderia contaminans]UUX37470.1 hypothetical protein NTJ56_01170 [Burkholderia contaminans]